MAEKQLPNFAAMFPGWKAYADESMRTKKRMPPAAQAALTLYIETEDANELTNTTFKHIAAYMESGNARAQAARFEVACSDFGYTLVELQQLREEGKTAATVAKEILARV